MKQSVAALDLASVYGLHGIGIATGDIALLMVITSAGAAIILVALVPREERVEGIRAVAELLAAMLPWTGRSRRRRGQ